MLQKKGIPQLESVLEFEHRLKKALCQRYAQSSDLVSEGAERTGCIHPDFAEVFFTVAGQRF